MGTLFSNYLAFGLAVLLTFFAGCHSRDPEILKRTQFMMGTLVEITLIAEDNETTAEAISGVFQEIQRIEKIMSRSVEGSDIWHVNQGAGERGVEVSPDAISVIRAAQEISHLSGGAFDITVGSLVSLWDRCRKEDRIPSRRELAEALRLVGYRDLEIREEKRALFLRRKGMELVLGGIAKGYAVDQAVRLLQGLGFRDFIVNAGGDLRTGGTKLGVPWVVGIQDPRDKSKILVRMTAKDSAVATSGDYERYFVKAGIRYHHILDPFTGFPAEKCRSVTVLHRELMWADALATAVFVLGPEKGMALVEELPDAEALIIDSKGEPTASSGMKGKISFQ